MTIFIGRYATGVIVGSYRAGGLLEASVEVTANHGGQRIIVSKQLIVILLL